ncbi:stage IV sporulation protein FB [Desulfohalotomaculum tongense]|uniref:M50 family metallopeptidase n=1 Tax=Desulforadius tongensis TaxID=1216062 RepID=UPI0019599871|nr:M50 family metallopeptidase [Desulforadius tongensis]MBM7854522.1 stage IV sporulation protein FB [Desulforadius tongensis]
MKIGRVYGIDMYVNGWFLFQLSLFFVAGILDKGLILFGVVLVHEIAHTIVAMRLGVRVLEVELLPFGGVARLGSELALNTQKEMAVAVAGPFSNLALIALALGFRNYGLWNEELGPFFLQCNMMLAGFNLLPALPLDGGRVVRAYLARWMGLKEATYLCSGMGQAWAVLITSLAVMGLLLGISGLDILILGLFIFYAATREKSAAPYLFVRQLTEKKRQLAEAGVMPAETVVSLAEVPLREVIKPFVPRKFHFVVVLGSDMRYLTLISEIEVVDALLTHGMDYPVGQVKGK